MSTFRIIALKVLDDSPKYQSKVLMPCTTYFFFPLIPQHFDLTLFISS